MRKRSSKETLLDSDQLAGQWVAMRNGNLIAAGRSVKEVITKSKKKGVILPLILKVPRKDEGPYVLIT